MYAICLDGYELLVAKLVLSVRYLINENIYTK